MSLHYWKYYTILCALISGLNCDVKCEVERRDIQKFGQALSAHCDTRALQACLVGEGAMPKRTVSPLFGGFFYDESDWDFLGVWPPTLQCHMPKMAPSGPSSDTLHAKNVMFVRKSIIVVKRGAGTGDTGGQSALFLLLALYTFGCIMPLCTNMTLLAWSKSKDGLEGAIFGICGTGRGWPHPEKVSAISTKEKWSVSTSTASGTAPSPIHHTSSAQ